VQLWTAHVDPDSRRESTCDILNSNHGMGYNHNVIQEGHRRACERGEMVCLQSGDVWRRPSYSVHTATAYRRVWGVATLRVYGLGGRSAGQNLSAVSGEPRRCPNTPKEIGAALNP